jgi:predicted RNase H-like HicB family nuclease
MIRYTYSITIEIENEQCYAFSNDLPGVYGVGASIEEAKISILEAFRLHALESKKPRSPISER